MPNWFGGHEKCLNITAEIKPYNDSWQKYMSRRSCNASFDLVANVLEAYHARDGIVVSTKV